MASSFFERFRRVTASTDYLPEIDGLRFLAVFWVAIIMHATHYIDEKLYSNQLIQDWPWKKVVLEGVNGMNLFFMISGFVLSLPFAKAYLKGGDSVNLKRYYLRRLTRLEPPYIIALFVFFLAHVFIIKKYALGQMLPSLLASLIYSHDLIFNQHSLILPVAWSLEVEVQFYILAPLFCLLFKIKPVTVRRFIFLILIIGSFVCARFNQFVSVLLFLHYFIAGLLLTDLYVSRSQAVSKSIWEYFLGVILLTALLSIPSYYSLLLQFLKVFVLFLVFYLVLFNSRMKTMFSAKGITLIGGMCYSIYLLHFGIISGFGTLLLSLNKHFDYNHAPLYLLAMTGLILLISAAYFYYVEKPFMQFKLKRLEQKSKKERSI